MAISPASLYIEITHRSPQQTGWLATHFKMSEEITRQGWWMFVGVRTK